MELSNCCGAKVEGLNAENIGRCLECGEGCGVEDVKEDLETVMRKILGDDFESFLDNLTERLKMSKEIKKEGCGVEETVESLISLLSKPIEYQDNFYYLQVSQTRCWYMDLEGNSIGLHTYDVCTGDTLFEALQRMEIMRRNMEKEIKAKLEGCLDRSSLKYSEKT